MAAVVVLCYSPLQASRSCRMTERLERCTEALMSFRPVTARLEACTLAVFPERPGEPIYC